MSCRGTPTNSYWSYGIFNHPSHLRAGEEMRFIVLRSAQAYPLQRIGTGLSHGEPLLLV